MIKLLSAYRGFTEKEEKDRQTILAFVKREPRCFERSTAEGHITASAWLVDRSGLLVLLTHHKKLGKWLQLGGHADGDSDILAVALREAFEESGIRDISPVSSGIFDVDVHLIPARGFEPAHFHYDVRFACRTDSLEYALSPESHELSWIPIKDVQLFTEEGMRRMAEKWLRSLTHPSGDSHTLPLCGTVTRRI